MTDITQHSFENIVKELAGCGNSRTWSILVTIFGDLAQNPEDEISGPLLSSLTKRIGIKPQAMRVALHRLRRDGWIVTEKSGRTSKHRLSEFGLTQSATASPHIYAQTVKTPEAWHIIVANPAVQIDDKSLVIRGYRRILSGIYIGGGTEPQDTSEFLVVTGSLSTIPKWLQDLIANEAIIADHIRLRRSLSIVEYALENGYAPTIVEAAVIRTLIVHDWRRMALRQPDLSVEFVPQSPATQCRADVWKLLERLERPSLAALEAAAI